MAGIRKKIGELFFSLRADSSGLKRELDEAGQKAEQSSHTITGAFGKIGAAASRVQAIVSRLLIPVAVISSILGAVAAMRRWEQAAEEARKRTDQLKQTTRDAVKALKEFAVPKDTWEEQLAKLDELRKKAKESAEQQAEAMGWSPERLKAELDDIDKKWRDARSRMWDQYIAARDKVSAEEKAAFEKETAALERSRLQGLAKINAEEKAAIAGVEADRERLGDEAVNRRIAALKDFYDWQRDEERKREEQASAERKSIKTKEMRSDLERIQKEAETREKAMMQAIENVARAQEQATRSSFNQMVVSINRIEQAIAHAVNSYRARGR